MYKILVDEQLFCSSKAEDLAILNPIIKLSGNNAGTFTFIIPPNHPYYDSIKRKTSIIDVYRDDDIEPVFEGVCVSDSVDFFKQKKIECEGELTFFNDSFLRPAHREGLTSRQLLQAYINEHNSNVEAFKRFTIGQVTAKDTNDYITCFTNYQSTMTEIKEDLIDDIGGYLRTRHVNGVRYLDYLAESPRTNNQIIRLGENLLDISIGTDTNDLATVIIPLGAMLETQTIEGLDDRVTIKTAKADTMHPSGKDYVYSQAAVNAFGWIEKVVEWNDVKDVNTLLSKGEKYLKETQFENLVIEAKAIDLGLTSDEFQKFKLLDKVRVLSEVHGLDKYFMISEMEIHLNNPEQDTITLGSKQPNSMSAKQSSANAEVMKRIEQMPTSAAVQSAIDNATALITGSEGGYVVLERNADGQPTEIRIQDALNNPTKIWRWNRNGFGYSSDGGRTYGLAMTMDGAIVADYITAGTMTGDRVRGGTFEIGGTSLGKNGKILVKNAQGQTLITIDKNGIAFSSGEGINYSDISGAPKTIKKTTKLFYMATTDTWPTKPTSKVTDTDANQYNTWIAKMPNYGTYSDYYRVFTIDQYEYTDNTVGWGTLAEYSFRASTTQITKDTVTTAYVNALNVTAKYISTQELAATGVATIAGWIIQHGMLVCYNNGTEEASTRRAVIWKYNTNAADTGIAFGVQVRNSVNEEWKNKFGVSYGGDIYSQSTVDFYPTDTNYGVHIHGALAVDGKIHMDGGIIEGCGYITATDNIYAGGNISGRVTDGRTGLNCTGGGLYVAGNGYFDGSLGCGGTKPRIVHTDTYGYRAMNAYETPTPYFGDIGEGILNEQGECIVFIDDIFAECVNLDVKYQVFLQKYGQGDIWVEERTPTHFVVKGTPNIKFGWELKAVQLYYEDVRLDTPDDKMLATIIEHYAQEGV